MIKAKYKIEIYSDDYPSNGIYINHLGSQLFFQEYKYKNENSQVIYNFRNTVKHRTTLTSYLQLNNDQTKI